MQQARSTTKASLTVMERRQHSRIEFTAQCRIVSGPLESLPAEGVTENISRSGLMFRVDAVTAEHLPDLLDAMVIDVVLRPHRQYGRRCLRCRGQVVRVVPASPGARIAIAIGHMEFRDFTDHMRRQTGEKAWNALLYRA